MSGHVRVGGAWKTVAGVSTRVGGAWKTVTDGWTKVGGVWKQWFSSAPEGAYEHIATVNGTGASGIVTFSSIPQDFKHLQLRWVAKTTGSGSGIEIRFNNDATSGRYARHLVRGDNATVEGLTSSSQSRITLTGALASSTVTGSYAVGTADILDYSSEQKEKTLLALYGRTETGATPNGDYVALGGGLYMQTTSITSITIESNGNPYATATRFSLYGMRG